MDELMQRYKDLCNKTTFNPEIYSLDWEKLSADFEAQGRVSMANGCLAKALHYQQFHGYAHQLEFIDVTPVQVDGVWSDFDERILFCLVCDTYTKHAKLTDGWMCGCGEFIQVHENV